MGNCHRRGSCHLTPELRMTCIEAKIKVVAAGAEGTHLPKQVILIITIDFTI